MLRKLIALSIQQRFLVLMLAGLLTVWGIISVKMTPLDAIPDLSDVQVIIKTSYAGQAPQVVEDQVTYPITTTMLSVPKATAVRGFSFFGDSFVYVIFEDGTDIYWARARVLSARAAAVRARRRHHRVGISYLGRKEGRKEGRKGRAPPGCLGRKGEGRGGFSKET